MGFAIVGRPSAPQPESVNEALKRAVASVPGVAEAHFPQLFLPGRMEKPEQTLVIIPGAGRDEAPLMQGVMAAIRAELPKGPDIPAMLVRGSEGLAGDVRGADCQLYRSATEQPDTRRWWQFWK